MRDSPLGRMAIVLVLVLASVHTAFPHVLPALFGMRGLGEVVIGPVPEELPATGLFTGLYDYDIENPPAPEMLNDCDWIASNPEYPHDLYPAEFVDGEEIVTTADGADRCGYPEKEWPELLEDALYWFGEGAASYASYGGEYPGRVYVAYGLLNPQIHWGGSDEAFTETFRRKVLPQLYRSPELMEVMYRWAMPAVKRTFTQMPEAQQTEYLAAFFYARTYLTNFDYAAELAYYNRLERGECDSTKVGSGVDSPYNDCPWLFTQEDRTGREHPYRKLEAFVFRRVHFDHVPAATLALWLNRVIDELREGVDRRVFLHADAMLKLMDFNSRQPQGLPEFRVYDRVGLDEPIKHSPCKFYKPEGQRHWYPRVVGQPNDKYWQVPVTELERCGYKPLDIGWTDVVTGAVDQLGREPATYGDWLQQDPSLRVPLLTAYGLLQTGNGPIFDRERALTENFRREVLPQLYRSPALLEAIYAWVKPQLLAKFAQIASENRAAYLDILRHGEQYLATFNYERERAYLARLERGQCKNDPKPEWWDETRDDMKGWAEYWKQNICVLLFTHQGPNGRTSPYRKFESFIFRRAHADKVPVDLMRRWIGRFRADLEAVHRTASAQATPTNTP